MNRCPHCQHPLRFLGIRAVGGGWERWDTAGCGFYLARAASGAILNITGEEPRKGYFNGESVR